MLLYTVEDVINCFSESIYIYIYIYIYLVLHPYICKINLFLNAFGTLLVVNDSKTVEEYKTNLMSFAILFHFLCAQHVSDVNISIIRILRLFY